MSSDLNWRKSSYSGGSGGNCIEVGNSGRAVLVRDTKQADSGPVLRFSAEQWRRFAVEVRKLR
jgi:Domain of unknown function (DUF397)